MSHRAAPRLAGLVLLGMLTPVPSGLLAGEGNVTAAVSEGTLLLTGDGLNNSIVVYHVDDDGPNTLRVTGDFTTVNGVATAQVGGVTAGIHVGLGAGNDDVTVQEVFLPGSLSLEDNDGVDYLKLRTVQVGGDVVVRVGLGADLVEVVDSSHIVGKLDVLGADDTNVTLGATLLDGTVKLVAPQGALRINESQIHGKVSIEMFGTKEHALIVENRSNLLNDAKVKAGNGDTVVVVRDTAGIAGTLDVASLDGEHSILLENVAVVTTIRARFRDGPSSVQLLANATVPGNVTITAGDGFQHELKIEASQVGGKVKATLGDGDTVVQMLGNSSVAGKVNLKTGFGADTLQIGIGTVARRDVKAKFGDGASLVEIFEASRIEGTLNVTGGTRADTVSIRNASFVRGDAKLTLGGGNNLVELRESNPAVLGDLVVKSRDGADEVNTMNASVGGDAQLKLAGGENAVSLALTTVFGKLVVSGGAGGDAVATGQSTFVGSAKLLLGDGSNDVALPSTTFGGALTVKTGSGNDAIDLTGTTVAGKRTIDADGGANLVVVP